MQKKYQFYIKNFLVAFPMTLVMSFGNLTISQGFTRNFIASWFQATWVGLLISYPATLVIVPWANRMIKKINWK